MLTIFDNGRFAVDVITKDGAPWFRAAHVTHILGYVNRQQAVRTHVRAKFTATYESLCGGNGEGCCFPAPPPC